MNELKHIIMDKISSYNIHSKGDEKNAIREVTQELVLSGLSQTDFFKTASFHGGTSLRIIYGIKRFSEDLDFSLDKPDKYFEWKPYLENIRNYVNKFGCDLEVIDKSKLDSTIKKAFIKDTSIGQMMNFSWMRKSGDKEKINIKLEIDTNPALYANFSQNECTFPIKHIIKTHDLPSLFAGKLHACLCRKYNKGRDWHDFKWYIDRKVEPNLKYLSSMINQIGPWENQDITINKIWLQSNIKEKVDKLDMNVINNDINKFVSSINVNSDNLTREKLHSLIDNYFENNNNDKLKSNRRR